MSFTTIAGIVVLAFVYIVITQVAKSIEYMRAVKEKAEGEKMDTPANRVNAWLMIAFLVVGMGWIYWFHEKYKHAIIPFSASKEGETYDEILFVTFLFTFGVFLVTQTLLFIFAFKYRAKDDRLGFYFTHNNKLEILWTLIPSVALVVLIIIGLKYWMVVTGDAPKGAALVELTGKQYEWIVRYPGKDGVLGKRYYKYINDADNRLGQIWDDKANQDDIITGELHMVVNTPVQLLITSRDVVHDVGLPHFRMKMDAVPGLPTTMWFTPQYTTQEMRSMTNNPEFDYEIVCDQMCGSGHYAMRAVLIVETQDEFDAWMAKQKPYYATIQEEKAKANASATVVADATSVAEGEEKADTGDKTDSTQSQK